MNILKKLSRKKNKVHIHDWKEYSRSKYNSIHVVYYVCKICKVETTEVEKVK